MMRFVKKVSKKTGLPPGTLMHIGEKKTDKARIRVMDYDENSLEEKELNSIEEAVGYTDKDSTTWINIDGLHQVEVVEKVGRYYDLNPLVLEDILHTGQRPKMESYEGCMFIIANILSYDDGEDGLKMDQFSLVLGSNYIISFQERPGTYFNPVRDRLRQGKGRIRKLGADYLTYALIDIITDNYFMVLEKIGEHIEELEEVLINHPIPETLSKIHRLKRDLIFIRRSVWPLREMVRNMERGESDMFQDSTTLYFRDLYDHTFQVVDTTEVLREMVSGMLDVYLSSVSNKMNEVMKVLTIMATIFIPMTFITGNYGMNFKFMPELEWPLGYSMVWGINIALGITMLVYFRKKKWL